ncbi:hypothetical protein M2317_001318 [Microbacterium sp. ZKA21]|uniref:hypothetical protein n=1 Tax=Microbacterium sp. ZKA21 TaxID=3381694 RepID=UPI003D19DB58
MSDRACISGCVRTGEHYAACADYGRADGECTGCVPLEARDGAMVCSRCYGRLRRHLEDTPALIEHIRSSIGQAAAKRYGHERTTGSRQPRTAPMDVSAVDASRDIMAAIYAPSTTADASPAAWRAHAQDGIARILADYDAIANDADAFPQWWAIVMPHEIPGHDDYWTISRALNRWPLADRRRRANKPCPDCELLDVHIIPPRQARAPTWYACNQCTWEANEHDHDGLWAALFEGTDQ